MAKIGIVTQPLMGNYGGLLQNYALQTVLRHLGHEPMTIDYMASLRLFRYVLSTLKTIALYPVPSRRRKFAKWYPVRENELIDNFVSEHITKTDYVYHYDPTIVSRLDLDAVITGSDQVWRPMYNHDLKDLYLDFVKDNRIIRIAYAASFGTSEKEYTPANILSCKDAARRLDAISVREYSGVQLCQDYFGVNAVEVLDPTLLLTADDYNDLVADRSRSENKYIGVYILDRNPDHSHLIQTIKKFTNLTNIRYVTENDTNFSPQDWIAMIRDADYVITDSFHATVFSIIFRKQFITLCNHSRGADRFRSLLKPLGLMDRLVDNDYSEIDEIASLKINWDKATAKLDDRRAYSINFLKNNLTCSKHEAN